MELALLIALATDGKKPFNVDQYFRYAFSPVIVEPLSCIIEPPVDLMYLPLRLTVASEVIVKVTPLGTVTLSDKTTPVNHVSFCVNEPLVVVLTWRKFASYSLLSSSVVDLLPSNCTVI